jgi:adenosylcobinamide-GDP ribazoletransferase
VGIDWRRERTLFLTALRFLTRIPVGTVPHSDADLNTSARYFPLVGLVVGLIGALVYGVAVYLWPPGLALLLSIVTTVLLTGAFHEDGFADTCDGFGGGWERAQVLAIMKDSRIGTYGSIGLGLVLAMKFLSLEALDNAGLVIPALLVGHTWSRLLAVTYLADLSYAGDPEHAKAKPMATNIAGIDVRIATATVLPLVFLISFWQFVLVAIVLLLWRWIFGYYMTRRIGGYTGDCLGAAQQVGEVLIYLVLVAV